MKPIEIHQQLSETCNDGVMDVKNVRSWIRQFQESLTSCENKPKEPEGIASVSSTGAIGVSKVSLSEKRSVSKYAV